MSDVLVIAPPGALRSEQPDAVTWSFVDTGGLSGEGTLSSLATQLHGRDVQLVLPCADAMVSTVALAKKQARHIARVVPFLLEDQLLVAPDSQWFAWGAGVDGRYPVVAVDRTALSRLLEYCRSADISVRSVRIDAAELADLTPARFDCGDNQLLLLPDHAPMCLPSGHVSALGGDGRPLGPLPEARPWTDYQTALQQRAAGKAQVELLHGEFRVRPKKRVRATPSLDAAWRSFGLFMAVASLAALALLVFQGLQYQRAASDMRAQAGAAYEDLFPGDRATGRLESQFTRRLELAGGSGAQGGFLGLMTPVGSELGAVRGKGVQARSIQFNERDSALVIELSAPDFDTLQALKSSLEGQGLVAEIANYRNQGNQVTALLKVSS